MQNFDTSQVAKTPKVISSNIGSCLIVFDSLGFLLSIKGREGLF